MPPVDLPGFVEIPTFIRRWAALGLDDVDLAALQRMLGLNPTVGTVVRGAAFLRKARFSPPRWNVGKSGALRVYYAHLPGIGVIVLTVAFAKGEVSDISPSQRDALLAQVLAVEKTIREHL